MTVVEAIAGPTASGKSELALRLAEAVGGEIVSVDSMQLYRGLEIGVAKPTPEERRRVPHHLLDVLAITERGDIYRFCKLAETAIADIRSRGKIPILCGGTGFYFKALIHGLDDLPGDAALQTELAEQYAGPDGAAALRERMAALDPAALEKFRETPRKLLRALEVKLLSGKSILEQQQGTRPARFPVRLRILDWPPELLKARIRRRTEAMLEAGWLDEARAALAAGLLQTPTAHQALGYRQIGDYLAGKLRRDELIDAIATATWQFARRQRTWFRHQHPEAETVTMPANADRLIADWSAVAGNR